MLKGSSKSVVAANIKEMMHSGHSQAQAIAASMRMAGTHKKKMPMKPKRRMPMEDDDADD